MKNKWQWFISLIGGAIGALILGYAIAYIYSMQDSANIWIGKIKAISWGFASAFIIIAILIAIFIKNKSYD